MKGIPAGFIPISIIETVDGKLVARSAPTRAMALERLDGDIRRYVAEHGKPPSALDGWRRLLMETNKGGGNAH